jgi:hypothetical protein
MKHDSGISRLAFDLYPVSVDHFAMRLPLRSESKSPRERVPGGGGRIGAPGFKNLAPTDTPIISVWDSRTCYVFGQNAYELGGLMPFIRAAVLAERLLEDREARKAKSEQAGALSRRLRLSRIVLVRPLQIYELASRCWW